MILQLYFRDEKHARGSHGSHLFILGEDLEAKTSLLLVSLGFSTREMCGNARMNAHLYTAVTQQKSWTPLEVI